MMHHASSLHARNFRGKTYVASPYQPLVDREQIESVLRQLPLRSITNTTNAHAPTTKTTRQPLFSTQSCALSPGSKTLQSSLPTPYPHPPTASLCNTNSKHLDQSYVPTLKSSTAIYQTFVSLRLISPSSSRNHCQVRTAEVPMLAHIFRDGENSVHKVSMVDAVPYGEAAT